MARVNPLDKEKFEQAQKEARQKPPLFTLSGLIRLHRIAGLVLIVQLLIWTVTGFYFSWMGREVLNAEQLLHRTPPASLSISEPYVVPMRQLHQLGDVYEVNVRMRDELPQLMVTYASQRNTRYEDGRLRADGLYQAWFDGGTGQRWNTGAIQAQRIAVNSYLGSGMFNGIYDVRNSADLPRWEGPGFRVEFADRLKTRIYVDQQSGDLVAHRNRWSLLTEWMYKLHFMDYSGQRNFNNLLMSTAAIFSVWFVLTGILMLIRVWRQGGFVAGKGLKYNVPLFERLKSRLLGVFKKN
ncbi:PepSY domain-containing protein [Aliidiomarina indica]|uniref:PepSY domain-containing protein n=1 Tax=Aliidiomarina indica TaxID=2749147 RepID=UPI001890A606|nr:PepSY domain-containing protein [Aliidiomarina indica]